MKKSVLVTFCFLVILGLLWNFSSQQMTEARFILPSLSSIFKRLWTNPDLFITHSQATLKEMAGGFALALFFAFPLAWSMYLWKTSRILLQPLFIMLQSIPMFTLAPLMVLWFGWSYSAIVIPTALMIFFPLTMNIYQGLASTPQNYLDYFKIQQATPWQTFFKLQLPYALPHIFAGLRISAALAGIGAVAGEWAGAQSGLGILMLKSRRETDLETSFGALFCLVFISLSLYGAIIYAENSFKKHKPLKFCCAMAVIGLLGLTGFISKPYHAATHETHLLLDWLPNSNHVPIYAGLQKQIFAKYNIDLRILEIKDPSDTIPYLTAGKAEIALFYFPDVVRANEKGAELKIVDVLVDRPLNSLIYRKGEAAVPQDLSGKIIGYSVTGSNLDILEKLLKQNHIVPKELKNVNFDLVASLALGQVDVIYGAFWNIEKKHLESLGISTDHFEVTQLGHPHYSELVFISHKNFNETEAFQKAIRESIEFCRSHPDEAFDLYTHCHPEKSPQTLAWERQAWYETIPLLF
jgi:NitT/TauT family transport system substrate-binding protein